MSIPDYDPTAFEDLIDVDDWPDIEVPPELDFTLVNFRIVGIYLGSIPGKPNKNNTGDISVVTPKNPTVKEVVESVKRAAKNGQLKKNGIERFDYTAKSMGPNAEKLVEVEVEYDQPPKKNRRYNKGVYSLRQDTSGDPIEAFQYYINSVEHRQNKPDAVIQRNTDNTFRPFNKQPKNPIGFGDYVVWRLVKIRTAPDYTPMEGELGFDMSLGDLFSSQFQTAQSPLQRKLVEADNADVERAELPDDMPTPEEVAEQVREYNE